MNEDKKNESDKCTFFVGEKFSTFAELSKKIYAYQMENCVRLYKRDAKLITTMTKKVKDLQLKANLKLKYFMVVYACIYGGQLHANQKYKNKNQMCNMRIHFRMTSDGNFLEVKKIWDEHNHPLQTDKLYLGNRNPHEDLIIDLDNMSDESKLNYTYLYKEDGSHVTDECGNIVLYNENDGTYILTRNQLETSENNNKKVSWDSVSTKFFLEHLLKIVATNGSRKFGDETWIELFQIMKQKNFSYQPCDLKKRWGALKNIYKYDMWTHGYARGQYANILKKILPNIPEKKAKKGLKRLANGSTKIKDEEFDEDDDDEEYLPDGQGKLFLNENDGILQVNNGIFENEADDEEANEENDFYEDENYDFDNVDDSEDQDYSIHIDNNFTSPDDQEDIKPVKKSLRLHSNQKDINSSTSESSSLNPLIDHIDECFDSLKNMMQEQHCQNLTINKALLAAINGLQETLKK